jgi:sugar phosphate isomerase/epimerase
MTEKSGTQSPERRGQTIWPELPADRDRYPPSFFVDPGGSMNDDSNEIQPWEKFKDKFPFGLCLVAEEIGDDFARVVAFARSIGIEEIEIGSLWGARIDAVPFGRLVAARDILRGHGMRVRAVTTQAFKTVSLGHLDAAQIPADPHYLEDMELFRTSVRAAEFLGAPLVRAFSFRREGMTGLGNPSPRLPGGGVFPEEMVERVALGLAPAIREAEVSGVVVALENVRSCWCNSGRNTRKLLETVGSQSLRAIWDPANAYVSGEEDAVDAGYDAAKPFAAHVHLKDAVVENADTGLTRWERIGDGEVGLGTQLEALRAESFDGCISLETHWAPPGSDRETNTRRTYTGLIELLAALLTQ